MEDSPDDSAVEEAATPGWKKTEASSPNGDDESGKKTPEWAQTLPTDPGAPIVETVASEPEPEPEPDEVPEREIPDEPEEIEPPAVAAEVEATPSPLTKPPKAAAADATRSTWPPSAETAPAPPAETDIWPPEPPTERAMPAWPPPSELEEPQTPAQAIPSWPDSFDAAAPAPAASTPPVQASPAPTVQTPAAHSSLADSTPPTITPAAPRAGPLPAEPKAPVAPAAQAPTAAPQPPAPTHAEPPVSPSQPGPPSRPAWAPLATDQPGTATPAHSTITSGPIQVPPWAPRVPLAAEPGTPTWFSPKEQIPHSTAQPIPAPGPAPQPAPAPPVVGGQLPVAPIQQQPAAPAKPAQPGTARPAWEVIQQARTADKSQQGPTPEDRSYAEWFAWAKRGGAPASACHAAAQGAFKALAAGKDVATAVQWATAAMSRAPENVSFSRQQYCAWYSLANIDLNLDQHRSHTFAMAAVHALDSGQDAGAAHAAGLAAAGLG